jgi:hypothetical protein
MPSDFLFPGFENPFEGFLSQDPQAAYSSFSDRFGASPIQQQYFQGQFGDIRNQFLGELGRQARGGQLPQGTFTSFLEGFPFAERFAALPPSIRGAFTSRFAPKTLVEF